MSKVQIDIIGETCLQQIHELGMKSAVIAGGMIRDAVLGGDWKDIDIYVPYNKEIDVYSLLYEHEDFNIIDVKYGAMIQEGYRNKALIEVIDAEYAGGIKVQVMPYLLPDNDMFKYSLINDFNFGIDQAVYDGRSVHLSDAFKEDKKRGTATLLKLDRLEQLPSAMEKFSRLKEKYPDLIFSSSVLSIKKERKKKVKTEDKVEDTSTRLPASGAHTHTIETFVRGDRINPAAEQLLPTPIWWDEIAVNQAPIGANAALNQPWEAGVVGNRR